MVIDPGHDLGLSPRQEHAANDVQLPQRHRLIAFPPQVAVLRPLARAGLDQPVADQYPVHAHPRRHRDHPRLAQLMNHPHRTPPGMIPAHLAYRRLYIGADLVRAGIRTPGPVRQGAKTAIAIPADPGMHALPRHLKAGGDLHYRDPGRSLQDRAVTLLDNRQLHQSQSRPPIA